MSARQREILEHASTLVTTGGAIVYSTCTIEPEENEMVVDSFLEHHPDFELEAADHFLEQDVCRDGFLQTFPHVHNSDGAFAARLVRVR
jgi:16S rRNA (cytosine967-C5)-methyltransferase